MKLSRRGFVKSVGATAGAAALPDFVSAQSAAPQTVADVPPLSLRNTSQLPGLTARGAGWLRFLWEKATTRDDWSSAGIPHPWWDRYTAPVVLSYGRFDRAHHDDRCQSIRDRHRLSWRRHSRGRGNTAIKARNNGGQRSLVASAVGEQPKTSDAFAQRPGCPCCGAA
jgi:hypothetical protein